MKLKREFSLKGNDSFDLKYFTSNLKILMKYVSLAILVIKKNLTYKGKFFGWTCMLTLDLNGPYRQMDRLSGKVYLSL